MRLVPDLSSIHAMTSPLPTLGELEVLNRFAIAFEKHDDIDIYFQPRLGSIRPDIVVVRAGHGCTIVEVKDWALSAYNIVSDSQSSKGFRWFAKSGEGVHSPHTQVDTYKQRLFTLAGLDVKKRFHSSIYGVVYSRLFFANSTQDEAKNVSTKYTKAFGREWLNIDGPRLLSDLGLNRPNENFTQAIYDAFTATLDPRDEPKKPTIKVSLSNRQIDALDLPKGGRRKIRGIAGSGKTHIGAVKTAEVANAYGTVLYIVFNEAAMASTRHIINHIDIAFPRKAVTVETIFQFSKPFHGLDEERYLRSTDLLHDAVNSIVPSLLSRRTQPDYERYDLIIVDESQDIKLEWMQALLDNFLKESGQLLILADEAQNIYGTVLEERLVRTPIPGPWFRLDKHFRSHPNISKLCDEFRREFLGYSEVNTYTLPFGESVLVAHPMSFANQSALFSLLMTSQPMLSAFGDSHDTRSLLLIARTRRMLRTINEELKTRHPTQTDRIKSTTPTDRQSCELFITALRHLITPSTGSLTIDKAPVSSNEMLQVKRLFDSKRSKQLPERLYQLACKGGSADGDSDLMLLTNMYQQVIQASSIQTDGVQAPSDTDNIQRHSNDLVHRYSFTMSKFQTELKREVFADPRSIVVSTAHSAKGVERDTVVLLVDADWHTQPNAHELLYTALSRAKSLFSPQNNCRRTPDCKFNQHGSRQWAHIDAGARKLSWQSSKRQSARA